MTVTLIISTYNFTNALHLCLQSVCRQTRMPDEIVIADDGSTADTKALIDEYRSVISCPLKHVWHEDHGFRKTRIMNEAFAVSTSDYLVQIDGDIIMERHFIEDHCRLARNGVFYNGSRSKLTEKLTNKIFNEKLYDFVPSIFTDGVIRKENAFRMPLLRFFTFGKSHCIGCNMSFWRDDILKINGYNELMTGYGSEDSDLSNRLMNLGLKRRHLKFAAIEFHIYHPEHPTKFDKDSRNKNHKFYDETLDNHISQIVNGISCHNHSDFQYYI